MCVSGDLSAGFGRMSRGVPEMSFVRDQLVYGLDHQACGLVGVSGYWASTP